MRNRTHTFSASNLPGEEPPILIPRSPPVLRLMDATSNPGRGARSWERTDPTAASAIAIVFRFTAYQFIPFAVK